jgi:methylenetetrahydrofolate dehydrogenase (NADP+)/methenyltetrahydrofolate cyclohydrolase
MTARLLDGRAIAAAIRESVLPDVHAFTARAGRPPGLGIVLVGEDPSSEIYVRNKVRAGTESGLWVDLQRLPADASLDALLNLVSRLRPMPTTAFSFSPRFHRRWARAPRSRSSTRSIRPRMSTAFTP